MRILHPVTQHSIIRVPVSNLLPDDKVRIASKVLQGKYVADDEVGDLPTVLNAAALTFLDPDSSLEMLAQVLTPGFLFAEMTRAKGTLSVDLAQFAETRISPIHEDYPGELDDDLFTQAAWVSGRGLEYVMLCELYPNSELQPMSRKSMAGLFVNNWVTSTVLHHHVPDPIQEALQNADDLPFEVLDTLDWSKQPASMLENAAKHAAVSDFTSGKHSTTLLGITELAKLTSTEKQVLLDSVANLKSSEDLTMADLLTALT